jgi:hypothetical protein
VLRVNQRDPTRLTVGRKVFSYSDETVTGIPNAAAPNLLATSYAVIADITVPQGGAEPEWSGPVWNGYV